MDRAEESGARTGGRQQPASVIIFEEQNDVMGDVFELEEESDSEFEDDESDIALEDMDGEDGLVWTIDGEIPFDDGDYPTTEAFLESLPRHMKRRLSEEQQELAACQATGLEFLRELIDEFQSRDTVVHELLCQGEP